MTNLIAIGEFVGEVGAQSFLSLTVNVIVSNEQHVCRIKQQKNSRNFIT